MSATETLLAIDVGAESGRGVAGRFDGKRLELEEIHRFANQPVTVGDTLHWDILSIFSGVEAAIEKARAAGPLRSVGIDTWGVDFGLLDRNGRLISNPVHYRDRRTEGMMARAFEIVPQEEIFQATGNMFLELNSLYQLLSLRLSADPALKIAARLLMIPDLLHYWLCGVMANELTVASSTQCLAADRKDWAWSLLQRLEIPAHIFGEIVPPGTVLGPLRTDNHISVVAPASHDSNAVVMAVPARGDDIAWISCGTWSVLGALTAAPVITPETRAFNFTNEATIGGQNRLSRNIMGLWILQQCRQDWAHGGETFSYAELVGLAEKSAPLRSLIDPDDGRFFRPGRMVGLIQDYCRETGQPVPHSPGEITRGILESLALTYRKALAHTETLTKREAKRIHIMGGGSQNTLLCQLTADATGRPVIAGPIEATAIGNLLAQALAHGWIGSLAEMTEVVRASFPTQKYRPRADASWEEAFGRFEKLTGDRH